MLVRTRRTLRGLVAAATVTAFLPAGAIAAGSAASAAPAVAGGWGAATSSYIGTYHLVPAGGSGSPAAPVSSTPAGVFSLAVHTAAQLQAAGGPVSSGALKTFLRKVKTGEPLAPSGILSIFGSSGTQVLYLTDLDLHGSKRIATVNGGSFLGVPIGTLTATAGPDGTLDAVIKASGLGTAHVRLLDFSAAPPSS